MTAPIEISKFDPEGALTNPVRSLSGVVEMGTVTPDTDYGAGIYARWLYVGVTGDIAIKKVDGTSQVLTNLVAGVWHPIYSIGVLSSGTTATGIVWGM